MNQQQKCSQCLQQFTLSNAPHSMPTCQHNICTRCLKQAIQHKQQFIDCGYCEKKIKKNQIRMFNKNNKLIDKLKLISTNSQNNKQNAPFLQENNKKNIITKIIQDNKDDDLLLTPHQNQHQHSSLLQLKNKQQNYSNNLSQSKITQIFIQLILNENICKLHQKPLQIICATDKYRICSHCAIFGNHKDHRFKTIIQFQQELNNKNQMYFRILKQKQQFQQNQNINNIKSNIQSKIINRKILIAKQIQKSFKQIIQNIIKIQKSVQLQLEDKFELVKKKISQRLQSQQKIKKTYTKWQTQCLSTINQLKNSQNIKQKIKHYYDSPLQICEQGQFLLNDMTTTLTFMVKQIQQHINSICIETSQNKKSPQKQKQKYIKLIFPILQNSNSPSKQLLKFQQSLVENDFLIGARNGLFRNLSSSEIFHDNSFVIDQDISSVRYINQQIRTQKKTPKNNLINRTINSFKSFNNQSSILTTVSPSKLKISSNNNHTDEKQKQLHKRQSDIVRVKSPCRQQFKSPDQFLSRSPINKPKLIHKSTQQILNELSSNDFINQVDLTQLYLNDNEIIKFFQKAKKIRQLKAVKLQKNNLTDAGLQQICCHLKNIFNLNFSFNQLTEKAFDILLKNKQYLYKLRIINLSNNKISYDKNEKRIKDKLDQFKKIGILVTL